MDEHDPKRWTCESCTFANISKNRHCGVCLNPRPKSLKQRQRQSGGVKASSNDTTTESEESAAIVLQEAEVKFSVAPTEPTEMSSDSSVQPQILDESYHNFCYHVWANLNKTESLTALHQEGQSVIVRNGQLKSDGDGGEMLSGKEEENVNHTGVVSAEVPRVKMTNQGSSDGVGSQETIAVKPEQIILTAQDFVFPATHHSLSNRQNAPMDVDDEDTSLGGDAGEAWQCLKCTFANNSRFVKCDLCGLKRPRAPKSAAKKSNSAGTNDEFVVPTVINLARTSRSSDKSTVKDEKMARSLTEPPYSPVSTGMKRTASQSSLHRSPRPTLWNKTAETASKSNNPMLNIVNNINDFLESSNTSVNNDNLPTGDINHQPLADTHSLLSLGQSRADKHSREQSGDDEQEGRDTWECSQCTLENSFKNKRCSVCGNRGPKSSGRSHQNTPGSVRRARPVTHESDGGGSPKRQRREDRPQADDHHPDETNEKSEDDESEEQEEEANNRRSQSRGRRRKGSGFTRIKRHVRGRNTRDKKEQQSTGKDEKEDRGRSRNRPAENRPKDNSAPMNTVRRTSQNSRRRDPSPDESSEEETSDSETEAPPNVDPVTGKRKYDMTNRIKKGEVSKAAEKMLESSSRSNRRDGRRSSERNVDRQSVERSERSRSGRGDGDRNDRHRDRSPDRRGRREEDHESSRRDRRAERGYDSSERHGRQRRPDRDERDRNSARRSRDRSEIDSRSGRESRSRSERRGRRGSGSDEDENASDDGSQHGSEGECDDDNNGEKDKTSATEEVDDEPRDSRGRRIGARGSKGRAERRLSDQLSIDRPVEKSEKTGRPERLSQNENESEKEDKPSKAVEDDVPRDRRGRRIGMRNAQHYARRREREEEERRRAEAGGDKSDENQKSGSEEEEQEEKSGEEQEEDDEPRDSRGRRIGARGSKSRAEREGRILDNSRSRSRSQRDGGSSGSRNKVEVDNEPRDRRGRRIGMRNAQHYARRREREEEEARRNGGQVPKETSSERHHHSSRSASSRGGDSRHSHSHSHRSSSHRHDSERRHSRSSSSRHHHSSRSHSLSHRDSASENQRSSRSSQHHSSSSQQAPEEVDDEPRDSRGRRIGARGKKHKQSHGSDGEPAAEDKEQHGATSQGDPYVRPDRRFKANRHLPPNPRDRGARFNAMTYGNENGPADGQTAANETSSNARPTRSSRGDGNDVVDYNTSLELLTILSRTQQRTGGDKSARKGYAPRKYKSDDPNNNFVSKGTKVGEDYQVSFLPPCDNAKHIENLAKHRPAPGSNSSYVPHPYNEDNELYSVLWFATSELDAEYIPFVENNLDTMEVAENNLDRMKVAENNLESMDVAEDYLEQQREVMGEIVSDILAQVHNRTSSSSSGSNSSSCVTHPLLLPLNIKTEPAAVSTAMEEDNYNPDTTVAADDDIINVSSSSESDELLPLQPVLPLAMELASPLETVTLPAITAAATAAATAVETSLVKTEPALSHEYSSMPVKIEEISVSGELCANDSVTVVPATGGVSDPVFDATPTTAANTVDNSRNSGTKSVVATSTAAPIDFTAGFTDEKHDNWDRHSDADGSDSVHTSESSSNCIGDSDNVSGTESSSVDDDGSILTDELFSDENSENENETETSDEDYVESLSSDLGFGMRRSARKSSSGAATSGVNYADATGRGGFSRLLKATSTTSSYMSSSNGHDKNDSSEAFSGGFSSSFNKKSSPFDFLEFTREVEAHIAARTTPSSLYFKSAASVSDTHHKKVGANTMITNFIEAQLGLLETVCEYIDVIGEQRSEAVETELSPPAGKDSSEWELLSDDFDQYGDSPDEDMSVSAASEHSSVAAPMDTSTDTVEIEEKCLLNVNEPADGTAVSDFSTALSTVLKSFNTLPDDLLAHGSVVCKEEHTETVPVKLVAAPVPVEAPPKGVPKTMGRPTKAVLQARAAAALAAMNIAMLEPAAIAATQVETNQSFVSVVVSDVGTTATINTASTAVVVLEEKSSAITTIDTAVVTHDDEDGYSSEQTECAPQTLLLRYLAQYPEMQVYALRTLYQSHYCVEAAEERMTTALVTAEKERSDHSLPLISASNTTNCSTEISAIEDIKPILAVSGTDTSDPVPMEVINILDSQSIGDSSSSALTCINHSTDVLEPEKTPLSEPSPVQQTLQTVLTDEEKIALYNSRPFPLVDHDIPTLTADERQAFSEALVLHWDFWRDVKKELNNKWTISQLQGYFHCVYGTKHKTEKHATERKHKAHVRNIERQKERAALAAQDLANGTEKRVVVRGSREIRSLQAAYCDRRLSRSICAGASSSNNLSQEGPEPADQPYTLPSTRKTPSPQVQNNSNSSSLYSAGTTTLLSVLGAAALVVERVGNAFFDYDFNEQEEGTALQTEEEGTPENITPAGEAVNVTVTNSSETTQQQQHAAVVDAQTPAVTDTQAKGLLGTPLIVGGIAVPLVVQPACALLFADEVGMVDLSSSDSEYSGAENDGDRGAAENIHEKHSDRRRSRERSRGSRGGSRSGSFSDSDGSRGSRMSVRSNGSSRSSGSSRSGDSRDSRRSRNSMDSQRGSVSSRSYSSGSDSDNHSQRSARRHKKTSKSTATLMINRSRSNSLSKYDMLAADKHTSSSGSESDLGSGRFSGSGSEVDSPRKKPRRSEKLTVSLGDSKHSV